MKKRNRSIRIAFTEDELKELHKKVKVSGLSQMAFIRRLIKGYMPKPTPPETFFKMIDMLYELNSKFDILIEIGNKYGGLDPEDIEVIKKEYQNVILSLQEKFLMAEKVSE